MLTESTLLKPFPLPCDYTPIHPSTLPVGGSNSGNEIPHRAPKPKGMTNSVPAKNQN